MLADIFGNETAQKVLLYIVNYDEGTPSGIARAFSLAKNTVYNQLIRLEAGGILVARNVGNQRMFSLNPRLLVKEELEELLRKILMNLPEKEFNKYFAERRRPRRTGKEL